MAEVVDRANDEEEEEDGAFNRMCHARSRSCRHTDASA